MWLLGVGIAAVIGVVCWSLKTEMQMLRYETRSKDLKIAALQNDHKRLKALIEENRSTAQQTDLALSKRLDDAAVKIVDLMRKVDLVDARQSAMARAGAVRRNIDLTITKPIPVEMVPHIVNKIKKPRAGRGSRALIPEA